MALPSARGLIVFALGVSALVVSILFVWQGELPGCPTEPGNWRGEAAQAVVKDMLKRAKRSEARLGSDTVEHALIHLVIDNRELDDAALIAMTRVTVDELADPPSDQAEILAAVPAARALPSHKFAVGLVASAAGLPEKDVSQACPGLGVYGAPGTPILSAPKTHRLELVTAQHDFTDYFRNVGIPELNKAVWGFEWRWLSAIRSGLRGPAYHQR